MLRMFFNLVISLCLLASTHALANDSEFYYAIESPFRGKHWETALDGGYDYSNPYLHVFSGTLSQYWVPNPSFSPGIEITKFGSSLRDGASAMQKELNDFGYSLNTATPDWSAVASFRITPISGLVDIFSSNILMVDISLLLRGGFIQYSSGQSPVFGTGLDLYFGGSATWGVHTSLVWDVENPSAQAWQSRIGLRVGPSLRF